MNELTELPNPAPGNEAKSATQLGILLKAASDLIDEQFRISERLDAKSRNQATIVATVFAGVQAGVISLLNGSLGPGPSGRASSSYVPYLAGTACLAAASLLIVVLVSYQAWRLRPEERLSVKTIRDYVEGARDGNPAVGVKLINAYTQIAEGRAKNNAARAKSLKHAGYACALTFTVVCVELILAFLAVIAR